MTKFQYAIFGIILGLYAVFLCMVIYLKGIRAGIEMCMLAVGTYCILTFIEQLITNSDAD